jgi:hypothetical protein
MVRFRGLRWSALGTLALVACNDPATAPLPDQLVVTRPPSTLVGAPGFPLMDTIVVRVLDAAGKPRVGVPVTWVVRDGGGSVLPLSDTSGTDGTTAAIWTLGARPGYNELRVSLGEESSHTFTAMGEVFRASEVVGDFYTGCGLVNGAIWCWGRGAPTYGTPTSNYDSALAQPSPYYTSVGPALFDDAREYTDLALGNGSSICALDAQGAVWCALPMPSGRLLPIERVPGFPPLRRGSLVGDFSAGICGLSEVDGRAWCMRSNSVAIVPGSRAFTVLRVEFTGRLFCGLQADSTAACWGDEPAGNGSSTPSPTPVTVSGGHRFVDLTVGTYFGCGRTVAGELWCWGKSYDGRVTLLDPTLTATGVTLAGASEDWLLVDRVGNSLTRGLGPNLGPDYLDGLLEGLENVAVAGVAEGGIGCVLGVENEVYCVREQWNNWTTYDYWGYFPVMPVRQAPPASAVLR